MAITLDSTDTFPSSQKVLWERAIILDKTSEHTIYIMGFLSKYLVRIWAGLLTLNQTVWNLYLDIKTFQAWLHQTSLYIFFANTYSVRQTVVTDHVGDNAHYHIHSFFHSINKPCVRLPDSRNTAEKETDNNLLAGSLLPHRSLALYPSIFQSPSSASSPSLSSPLKVLRALVHSPHLDTIK